MLGRGNSLVNGMQLCHMPEHCFEISAKDKYQPNKRSRQVKSGRAHATACCIG